MNETSSISVYLTSLQNRIFKLLPMKEGFDQGTDNHIFDYVDNILSSCKGAMVIFPQLSRDNMFIEIQNNLSFLKTESIAFPKWRATVLRTTRFVHTLSDKYQKGNEPSEK